MWQISWFALVKKRKKKNPYIYINCLCPVTFIHTVWIYGTMFVNRLANSVDRVDNGFFILKVLYNYIEFSSLVYYIKPKDLTNFICELVDYLFNPSKFNR